MSPSLAETLDEIYRDGALCSACPLGGTAKHTVLYRDSTQRQLSGTVILFVGQSPGEEEDAVGVPFVGRSGKELDAKLRERPFPRYGITNAILHHPPGNKYDPVYGKACQPFLTRTIQAVGPKAVVTLGRDAWDAVFRLSLTIPVIRLPHPAAMLYNPAYRTSWDMGWTELWDRIEREKWNT